MNLAVREDPGHHPRSARIGRGATAPFGAHVVPGGVRFTVASATADRVWLVLMDPRDGTVRAQIPFPQEYRVGNVFTMTVLGLDPDEAHYGYRVAPGSDAPILLDPYARAIAGGERWGERGGEQRAHRSVITRPDRFDWGGTPRPRIPREDLVVYELHVRGFTRHASSGVTAPGTYAGLQEKIPYLKELGINCVELLPVQEFDETDNTYNAPASGTPLPNFWGYNPLGFFAPKAGYAVQPDGAGPAKEFKELVRALHRAGIEVILDVVFNHTAEGDHRGPTLSFRALDEAGYYLLDDEGNPRNLTATGNTVNANHPVARQFILDCLCHWAEEFHIDGFRFDMASILTRGTDGQVLDNPPLLEAIAHDPVLAHCKLIAETTDATGLDQVGRFPSHGRWMEWNGRYRDTVRRFLTGKRATAGDLAARLIGSPDLYGERGPAASVNYITCHDGFTLADWASYDHRRNAANGEGGADGIPDDDSWNCGHEGPTDDPGILRLRRRQLRNGLLLPLVSHGVPMLLGGDEFGRTQQGNNNAYSQDNEVSWVDWSLAEKNAALREFVRRCLAFRRAHPVLRRDRHPHDWTPEGWSAPPVSWHGENPWQPDWSEHSTLLALLVHQQGPAGDGDTVFVAVNSGARPARVEVPTAPHGTRWHIFADTGDDEGPGAHPVGSEPALGVTPELRLEDHSAVVLTAYSVENS